MKLVLGMIAMVPVGNEVVVQGVEASGIFDSWHTTHPIVLDRTTGIVWSSMLVTSTLHPMNFATEDLGPELRRSGAPIVAKVVGCHVRTRGVAQGEMVSTVLTLAPVDASAYR